MKYLYFIVPVVALLSVQASSVAQGLFEGAKVRALAPGLGAGLGASMSNSKVMKRLAGESQTAVAEQAKNLATYVQTGIDAENKFQWATAEQAFRQALTLIAHRDGPGSPKSVATLQHLSKDCEKQQKLDDAINYQKTVLALAQRTKTTDEPLVLTEQQNLSRLFVKKEDYKQAEPVLLNSLTMLHNNPSLPQQQVKPIMNVYGQVLRKLHRAEDADKIEKAVAANVSPNLLYQAMPQMAKKAPVTAGTEGTSEASSADTTEAAAETKPQTAEKASSPTQSTGMDSGEKQQISPEAEVSKNDLAPTQSSSSQSNGSADSDKTSAQPLSEAKPTIGNAEQKTEANNSAPGTEPQTGMDPQAAPQTDSPDPPDPNLKPVTTVSPSPKAGTAEPPASQTSSQKGTDDANDQVQDSAPQR